jgi:hypothetical protein
LESGRWPVRAKAAGGDGIKNHRPGHQPGCCVVRLHGQDPGRRALPIVLGLHNIASGQYYILDRVPGQRVYSRPLEEYSQSEHFLRIVACINGSHTKYIERVSSAGTAYEARLGVPEPGCAGPEATQAEILFRAGVVAASDGDYKRQE